MSPCTLVVSRRSCCEQHMAPPEKRLQQPLLSTGPCISSARWVLALDEVIYCRGKESFVRGLYCHASCYQNVDERLCIALLLSAASPPQWYCGLWVAYLRKTPPAERLTQSLTHPRCYTIVCSLTQVPPLLRHWPSSLHSSKIMAQSKSHLKFTRPQSKCIQLIATCSTGSTLLNLKRVTVKLFATSAYFLQLTPLAELEISGNALECVGVRLSVWVVWLMCVGWWCD